MDMQELMKRYMNRLRDDTKYLPRTIRHENELDAGFALHSILDNNKIEIDRHITNTITYLDEQKQNTWDNFSFSLHKGFRQVDIIDEHCYLNSTIWNLLQITNSFWETLHIMYDGGSENAYVWEDKYSDVQMLRDLKNRIARLLEIYKKRKKEIS